MPLIKFQLEQQIKTGIKTDPQFTSKLYSVSKKAMDRFQSAQKQAQMNAGTKAGFVVAQQVASIAFANEMKGLQGPIADVVSSHVADAVDTFIKTGQVIIPVPLITTPAVIGAPSTVPVVPPGKVI